MKKIRSIVVLALSLFTVPAGINAQVNPADPSTAKTSDYTIIDLSTGEQIDVYYDEMNWKTINKNNNLPVDYYVINYADKTAPDTVHGITGIIVNGMIWKNTDGKWAFDDAKVKWDGNEFKMKDKYGRKVKWEKGSVKIKDWNNKYKSEAGDDAKYKEEWDKVKWKDGDVKRETGAQKEKTKVISSN